MAFPGGGQKMQNRPTYYCQSILYGQQHVQGQPGVGVGKDAIWPAFSLQNAGSLPPFSGKYGVNEGKFEVDFNACRFLKFHLPYFQFSAIADFKSLIFNNKWSICRHLTVGQKI